MRNRRSIRVIAFALALTLVLSIASAALAAYKTIPYGEQSDNVRKMQKALKNKGYYAGSVDGKFGPATKRAVTKYQKAIGIHADGKPGNKTLTALYDGGSTAINTAKNSELKAATKPKNPRTLYYGCSGARVRALQRALHDVDCYSGSIDGKYGDLTYAAVKKYQYKVGLHADGMAGTQTIASLNRKADKKIATSFILDEGSKGHEVDRLQVYLTSKGYDCGKDERGTFGSGTAKAVKAWQKATGKKTTGTISESQYNDIVLSK